MKYHVFRLIPPRKTFVTDMTEEERRAMGAHADYWRRLTAEGKVVVVGPVLDPAGPYGLGVVRLADDADPEALGRGDPVILAGLGFSFTLAPMMSAILPETVGP
jgi:uncharacterized protein YciI